tara:strand:+ start:121 stop:636 length:516 start_codon:yes stop_codon:yes gene_type:complete
MNLAVRKSKAFGKSPSPARIACQLCRGTNPMHIAMLTGITIESINGAKDLLINNLPEEEKEFVVAEYEKVEKMGMSIVVPPQIVARFGLNNEIVTEVMKMSFIIENLSVAEKQSIAFKIINSEIEKDFVKLMAKDDETNEDETREKSSEESGYDAEEESTNESSDEAQLKE